MTRRWIPLLVAALAGCDGYPARTAPTPSTSSPQPVPLPTPVPLPAPVPLPSTTTPPPGELVVRTGQGLYLVDALPGEVSVSGDVEVELAGAAPPAGTTVALNGIPLVPRRDLPGLARRFWSVDPAGAQPAVGGDGALTIVVQAGAQSLSFSLPCPPDPGVTSSPPPGASLGGQPALALSWTAPLPANASNVLPADFFPVARLRAVDATTGAGSVDVLSQVRVPAGAVGVALDVAAAAGGGYLAELSVPGVQTVLGRSAGYCGRLRRIAFAP